MVSGMGSLQGKSSTKGAKFILIDAAVWYGKCTNFFPVCSSSTSYYKAYIIINMYRRSAAAAASMWHEK